MSHSLDLEKAIKDLEYAVTQRDMALKLLANHEFRKIFVEGYWTQDAARLVQMSSDPDLSPEDRAEALRESQATGYMKRHIPMILKLGELADGNLPAYRQELERVRYFEIHGELPAEADTDSGDETDGAGY